MTSWGSSRERTAIARSALSMPARQALLDGILVPDRTVLDFGSGRGLDVKRLGEMGYNVSGWDPYFTAGESPSAADRVLLLYVLNVIESPEERRSTLESAWDLARDVLIVAGRLTWDRHKVSGSDFEDGVVTGRGTFQHLFSTQELRTFVEQVTGVRCVAGTPGVVYAFRHDADRLAFLARRVIPDPNWHDSRTAAEALSQVIRFAESRGRLPQIEELPSPLIELLGKARSRDLRRVVLATADEGMVEQGAKQSTLDTLLFLGMELFNGRGRLTALPVSIQANVKAFFSSYLEATRRADRLLLKLRDDAYLRGAMRNSVGKLTPSALYVHRRAIPRMPVVLRLYEHCGAIAAGRPQEYDILKLSHDRRAVAWLGYPDFDKDPHPRTSWSYSVSFPELDTSFVDFSGRSNRPLLHRKEEFLSRDDEARVKYERLTRAEVRAGLYANPSVIGTEDGWESELRRCGVTLKGHRLVSRGTEE